MSRGWFGRRDSPTATAGRASAQGATDAGRRRAAPPGNTAAPYAAEVAGAPPVPAPLLTIDALGRKCPIPIIMLAEQIRDVPVGQVIAVLADDPAAYTDVPAWCGMKSHEFVVSRELPSGWAFLIRRRY